MTGNDRSRQNGTALSSLELGVAAALKSMPIGTHVSHASGRARAASGDSTAVGAVHRTCRHHRQSPLASTTLPCRRQAAPPACRAHRTAAAATALRYPCASFARSGPPLTDAPQFPASASLSAAVLGVPLPRRSTVSRHQLSSSRSARRSALRSADAGLAPTAARGLAAAQMAAPEAALVPPPRPPPPQCYVIAGVSGSGKSCASLIEPAPNV